MCENFSKRVRPLKPGTRRRGNRGDEVKPKLLGIGRAGEGERHGLERGVTGTRVKQTRVIGNGGTIFYYGFKKKKKLSQDGSSGRACESFYKPTNQKVMYVCKKNCLEIAWLIQKYRNIRVQGWKGNKYNLGWGE